MGFSAILTKKQSGQSLTRGDIDEFVSLVKAQKISNAKLVEFLRLLTPETFSFEEAFNLADALAKSGTMFARHDEIVVDKQSAGIVSDASSLIFMSVLSSLGVKCVKAISNGYGDFRNSADRLMSISGFSANVDEKKFGAVLSDVGMAAVDEGGRFAPADKIIYDVCKKNKLVSIPLIAVSLVARKLALGSNIWLFDVKTGEGSIGSGEDFAKQLADYLIGVSKVAKTKAACVITALNEPLGCNLGNRPELMETIKCLSGQSEVIDTNLFALTKELVTVALMLAGKAKTRSDAGDMFVRCITSGAALKKFQEFVAAYGGDYSSIGEKKSVSDGVSVSYCTATDNGYIENISLSKIKESFRAIKYGMPRGDKEAGVEILLGEGERVAIGDKIARIVFSLENSQFPKSKQILTEAFVISKTKPKKKELFYKVVL